MKPEGFYNIFIITHVLRLKPAVLPSGSNAYGGSPPKTTKMSSFSALRYVQVSLLLLPVCVCVSQEEEKGTSSHNEQCNLRAPPES